MWRESDGIEAKGSVAAAVEECNEGLVAQAYRDERGFVGVVKRDGCAGDERVATGGREHDAVAWVVEREERFAKKREAEDAVDFYTEVRGEGGAIVDAGGNVFKAGLAKLKPSDCGGGERDRLAVG